MSWDDEWGKVTPPYSPDTAAAKRTNWDRMLSYPRTPVTFVDRERQQEVEDFYRVQL